jgi:hypothetical protein
MMDDDELVKDIATMKEKISNLETAVRLMGKGLDKVRLAQAGMQGKWAVIAVVGMAAVSALFKYLLP